MSQARGRGDGPGVPPSLADSSVIISCGKSGWGGILSSLAATLGATASLGGGTSAFSVGSAFSRLFSGAAPLWLAVSFVPILGAETHLKYSTVSAHTVTDKTNEAK